MTRPVLVLRNVSHRYGEHVALKEVSLSVDSGEVIALVGANGAGKTTLMRLVTTLLPLQSGEIERDSERIGYVPQRIVLWPDLTVQEQLEFTCDMHLVAREHARRACEAVGLSDQWTKLAAELSGGMQRRLSIAIALVHRPTLLILDEPNAGLDPRHRLQLRETLRDIADSGSTVLVSSHDLAEVERIADRVVLLANGSVEAVGTVAEVAGDNPLEERFR